MAAPRDLHLHSNSLLPPLLLLLFLFIYHNSHISVAVDFISRNQTISGDHTIISKGGKFELGFYSDNFIAIWWKNTDGIYTSVWEVDGGNPDKFTYPLELKISDDGNLVLLDQLNSQIWSTGVPFINSSSPVAVLLDSGNLVLRDGSDPSRVFWQSCDHPTDTWLPGCYLGLNKATGENRRLVSNWDHDSPGGYSLEIDSNQIVLKSLPLGKRYWASGGFDGQNFSYVPEMTASASYRFEYISNETVNYFTYASLQNDGMLWITVTYLGTIQQVGWDKDNQQQTVYSVEPSDHCDPVSCSPFGFSSCTEGNSACNCPEGFKLRYNLYMFTTYCERIETLQCGTKDRFDLTPNLVVIDSPDRSPLVGTAEDCELACLSNCSCTAYSYGRSCSLWFGENWGLQQVSSHGANVDSLYLRIGVPPKSGLFRNSKIWVVLIGTASSIAFCLFIYLLIRTRRRRRQDMKMVGGTLRNYSYGELKQLTRNFSEILGTGGFGSVFKGTLPDSTSIAVKKLEGNRQGEKQFRSEVNLGLIQHVNVIRLHGFCSEDTKKMLVYEFMPRGSLENHLFRSNSEVLDWKTRYQIALGTARGLSYLHEKCRDCIIHCDIKPENILLDDSYVPKVADFGLAKHVGRDFNNVLTTMRGTIGYLAPEWISGSSITAKADTYSYGMVLLEIISGRRNTEILRENESYYFPLLACSKVVKGDFLSLLDHRLGGDANLEELDRACKVACWCIQDDEMCRPSMGQVVHILEGVIEVDTPPIPRVLQRIAENPESIVYFSGL